MTAAPADAQRPLRIEMTVPTLDVGGMEVMVAGLARALAARGHDVGVTCLERIGVVGEGLARDGVPVTAVPTPGLRTNVSAPALRDAFARRRLDVVHAHSGVWLKSARAARAAGVPRVVHTFHGLEAPEPWFYPAIRSLAARYTDAVVCVSPPLAEHLRRTVALRPEQLVTLINGVDVARFAPGPRSLEVRRRAGLGADTPLVGIVARFDPLKNHRLLLDAFARVQATQPDAHLALVGDGPLRGEIEARVAQLGLGRSVHLVGELRDMPAVYRDFDVFVLPSLSEGTSISLLEAMASGVPAVATAVGGTPNLLDGGRAGTLVASEDVEALAIALHRALTSPQAREVAAAARRMVEARYSSERMVDGYERLYRGERLPAPAADEAREAATCAG